MQSLIAFLTAHWASLLGVGGILALATKYLPGLLAKELLVGIEDLMGKAQTPAQKTWAKATVALLDETWGAEMGDAKYAAAALWIVRLAPVLAPAHDQLTAFLKALGDVVKNDLDQASGDKKAN